MRQSIWIPQEATRRASGSGWQVVAQEECTVGGGLFQSHLLVEFEDKAMKSHGSNCGFKQQIGSTSNGLEGRGGLGGTRSLLSTEFSLSLFLSFCLFFFLFLSLWQVSMVMQVPL